MNRSPQLRLEKSLLKSQDSYGGTLRKKANGRGRRAVSVREPMHLILKSSKAKGKFSFGYGRNPVKVKSIVDRHCLKYGVKLQEFSNNFNHLHFLVKFPSRAVYLRFIRSLTAHLALAISGASKLSSLKSIFGAKGFWDFRPFTRVVRGWRGKMIARDYVVLNQLEALEILPKRKGRLRELLPSEKHWFK